MQRPDLLQLTQTRWDLIVIGGGITGAGILLEAARRGKKVLLLERADYASGASSRSSKMVHGGLRYIAQGDVSLTRQSLRERERLLQELPHMVVRLPYLFPIRRGRFPGRLPMQALLFVYDFLAGRRTHRWLPRHQVLQDYPSLMPHGLRGALRYGDALTDDARLVQRVLHEARLEGGVAGNYMIVHQIEPRAEGFSVTVSDAVLDTRANLLACQVVNATGAWADRLSGGSAKVRAQRGSHLFIAADKIALHDCLTFMHQLDGRPVFAFPWKGAVCIGTTDLDHGELNEQEPRCSAAEVDYLLTAVRQQWPDLVLSADDLLSSMAGVRPIIASGKGRTPSQERRDHAIWRTANGVVSVAGGKLTTFRLIALDVLRTLGFIHARDHAAAVQQRRLRCFRHEVADPHRLSHPLAAPADGAELREQIRWILRHEQVVHLDDLMLRRLRAGHVMARGGEDLLADIGDLCRDQLGWSETRWRQETDRYRAIIADSYSIALPNTRAQVGI